MGDKKERACPICASKERKTILDADEFILIQWTIDKILIGKEEAIKIVICAKCGCVYDNIIGGDT